MSELYKALHRVQGVIRGVKRDAKNPHFKNSYATLEQVTDTIRQHMQDAGLIWFQMPGRITDGGIEVTTVIAHAESGEEIRSCMEVPLGKRDPQGAGSALTYGQRYSLMAILGLPPTDDDAETAIDREDKRPAPEPVKKAASLKKDGAWESLMSELDKAMSQGPSLVEFDAELKGYFWKKGKSLGFNDAWMESLRDRLFSARADIEAATVSNIVDEIQDQFPGARVVNEQHPLMAG